MDYIKLKWVDAAAHGDPVLQYEVKVESSSLRSGLLDGGQCQSKYDCNTSTNLCCDWPHRYKDCKDEHSEDTCTVWWLKDCCTWKPGPTPPHACSAPSSPINTTSDEILIDGLSEDCPYAITVRAENKLGWGDWSSPKTYHTNDAHPTKPSPPTHFSAAQALGVQGSISATWGAPDTDGGAMVISYDLVVTSVSSGKTPKVYSLNASARR